MKQARTIVNHLREKLHKQPPLSNLHLSIWARGEDDSPCGRYSSDRCSPEDLAAVLFDLSIAGYYVRFVENFSYNPNYDYSIEMWLELSERRKTNIDASVVHEVVKIAEFASQPH